MDFIDAEVILAQLDGFCADLSWFEDTAKKEGNEKEAKEIDKLFKDIKEITDEIRFGSYKRVENLEEKYENFKKEFLKYKQKWENKAKEYKKEKYGY